MKKTFVFLFLTCLITKIALADLPENYQSLTAIEKQTYLWDQRITPSQWYSFPPIGGGNWASLVKGLYSLVNLRLKMRLQQSFTHAADEIPKGNIKFIHPSGSVAKIKFVATKDSPYVGIYRGGIGLARLSLALDPKLAGSYTPGMALKFFIDGYPSVNIQVMNSLNGQGENHNFFAKTFSNIIPEPEGITLNFLKLAFQLAVKNPLHLSVDHLSYRRTDGSQEKETLSPYQLFFIPIQTNIIAENSTLDFRKSLADIPIGTHLYRVESSQGRAVIHIGDLYTTSEFIASEYGDCQLFFQHKE